MFMENVSLLDHGTGEKTKCVLSEAYYIVLLYFLFLYTKQCAYKYNTWFCTVTIWYYKLKEFQNNIAHLAFTYVHFLLLNLGIQGEYIYQGTRELLQVPPRCSTFRRDAEHYTQS